MEMCDQCGNQAYLSVTWGKYLNSEGQTKFSRAAYCADCKKEILAARHA
jgi:hypothetical protein